GELAVAGLRGPRGHVSAGRHPRDVAGAATDVRIREQAERPRLSGPVAGSAILEDDRRDVLVERDGAGRRPGTRARRGCAATRRREQDGGCGPPPTEAACYSAGVSRQPTAGVVRRGSDAPATIASRTRSRSWVVAAARARPRST